MSSPQPAERTHARALLRAVTLLVAVAEIICIGIEGYVDWVRLIITCVPAAWTVLTIILMSINRLLHPGFHIAFDGAFTIVLLFFGIVGAIGLAAYSSYLVGSPYGLEVAEVVLTLFFGVAQFLHFVLACIDVHRRRHASFAAAQAVNNVHL